MRITYPDNTLNLRRWLTDDEDLIKALLRYLSDGAQTEGLRSRSAQLMKQLARTSGDRGEHM